MPVRNRETDADRGLRTLGHRGDESDGNRLHRARRRTRFSGAVRVVVMAIAGSAVVGCGAPAPSGESAAGTTNGSTADAISGESPVMTVTLPGEPAAIYVSGGENGAAGGLSRRLEERFPGLHGVSCLDRAAGIYSRTAQADQLPLAFSEFVLHWSGCPDPFAAVVDILTGEDGEDSLFEELSKILASVPATHVGFARAPAHEPYAWRWTVFLTQRDVEMKAVPTTAAPGDSLVLVVRFLDRVDGAAVITTRPDGTVVETAAGLSGDRMLAAVEVGERPGTLWIEVVANDTSGPHVVLLFPVEIGREPSRAWVGKRRRDEGWITDPIAAEGYARQLLDQDRARFGLPVLVHDEALADVARRHSAEMAGMREIAHVSPTSGSVVDRLDAAGYRAVFAAENIARSSAIADAHEGLMRSPGHRAAILSTRSTHVGIGVVSIQRRETGTVYLITQVFAQPR